MSGMQIANLLTGHLVSKPQGYALVFGSCCVLYICSGLLWVVFARGQQLELPF